jgi:hypothetical protein
MYISTVTIVHVHLSTAVWLLYVVVSVTRLRNCTHTLHCMHVTLIVVTVGTATVMTVTGLVLSPTLLLKTRVMTDPVFRNKMSLGETNKQVTATV